MTYDPPLDEGIKDIVLTLNEAGIDTFSSCEGGEGHIFHEPTVLFDGSRRKAFRAFRIAMKNNFPVLALRKSWNIYNTKTFPPHWELVFDIVRLREKGENDD
jgi:hypothetical protein